MLRVAAFTGGVAVPSARFRIRQYIPELLLQGIQLNEMYSRFGMYPPLRKWIRPFWAISTLAEQIPKTIQSHFYDLVILQREMFSTFVTLEPLTKAPRVLDVDDAIFLYQNGDFARKLAQLSDRVICGNNYLANWFSAWNSNIIVIPTAVDTNRYTPLISLEKNEDQLVIGWIGTSGNLKYVYAIESALAKVLEIQPKVTIRIVCDKMPVFSLIDSNRTEFIYWSETNEVDSIQGMDVGIMPLEDTEWTRGKCSYKMLQYMSCGLPVVVSPVGMNSEVLAMGNVGIGSLSKKEWVDSLVSLLESKALRHEMGNMGRQIVTEYFSIAKVAPTIAKFLTKNFT